ncbi:MAG: ATP-binding protein [Terriglobales bacterium]
MVEAKLCPLCQGSGWKPTGTRVARCDCVAGTRAEKLLERARIPRRYEHCELADFDTRFPGAHPSLAAAHLLARRFVEEYPSHDATGLLLVGGIGVGKTHLGVGVLKDLIRKGIPGLFCDYRELLKQIQNSYNASVQTTEMEVLRPVFEAELLVLDELGAVKPSEWVWDTVSLILNTRYNDKRATLITTNFPDRPAAAVESSPMSRAAASAREDTRGDRIGERMRSRLHEMCRKVEMAGQDFRQTVRSGSFQ